MEKIIYILIAIIVTFSCKKEEKIDPRDENLFEIINTNNTNLNIEFFDTTLSAPSPYGIEYILDIGDIARISFMSAYATNGYGLNVKEASIYYTDAIEIAVMEDRDTFYICDTQLNDSVEHRIFYNSYSDYQCDGNIQIDDNYIFHYPLIFYEGDTLSDQLLWIRPNLQKIYLSFYDNSLTDFTYKRTEKQIKHGLWNNQGKGIIAFRYKIDNSYKYFYFEIEINNYKEITFYRLIY